MSASSVEPSPQLWGTISDVKQREANSLLAATTLARIFGSGAASTAAWCAIYARLEGEGERYQLWLGAFKQIQTSKASADG